MPECGSWRCHDHKDESDMRAVASTVCAKNLHDSVSLHGDPSTRQSILVINRRFHPATCEPLGCDRIE